MKQSLGPVTRVSRINNIVLGPSGFLWTLCVVGGLFTVIC